MLSPLLPPLPTQQHTYAQVREIATIKLPDLNCQDVDAAMRTVVGTARNMGITVEGVEALSA